MPSYDNLLLIQKETLFTFIYKTTVTLYMLDKMEVQKGPYISRDWIKTI